MMKIGITGGIGSGKSYVCNLLKQWGLPVYNCDDEAKRLMTESPIIRHQLTALIGENAYRNNELNKPIIAEYLFANAENAEKVNGIVHPVVKQDFENWTKEQTTPIVIQECALLFESGFSDTVDVTVEIYAPKEIRLERAMKRDNATQQQVEARMASQMDEEEKRAQANYCIINDGKADLNAQIEELFTQLNNQITK
ncbi:MAG: dephospho-CoA kinase [Bacteroidaceae bacterium]|nr:dephospho-CoA kinase [Bacteroidaceae bacterium]